MSLVATSTELTDSVQRSPMPAKIWWARIIKHPWLMPYNRLAILVVTLNLGLFFFLGADLSATSKDTVLDFGIANFSIALLIRQQYVINGLFKLATMVPTSWPLWLRAWAGKVYHFGGIHVGGFFSGSVWLALFGIQIFYDQTPLFATLRPLVLTHLVILSTMMIAALPQLRHRFHNTFEIIGRFGSWTSLSLFWAQILITGKAVGFEQVVSELAVLTMLSVSTILPWLRLRKVPVAMTVPSNHVSISQFDYGVTPFAGSSTDLSRNPLLEWHSFANVPIPNQSGYKLTISRAGDWTGALIDDQPSRLWVKGIPTAGVGNIETLFKKVIWVATGSGIGPCLPHLLAQKVPAKLIWSTRSPRKTYGERLVNDILKVQPDALIWDTSKMGKPNLVNLAYQAFRDFDAEAIICISNKKLTFHLNYELESRGIPAYGAIWDS